MARWWTNLTQAILLTLVAGCSQLEGCLEGVDLPLLTHGEACTTDDECGQSLVCGGDLTCRFPGEPGTAGEGDECFSTPFCRAGLVCASTGFCAEPGGPGTAGLGEDCDTTDDCQRGLGCIDGACYGVPLPIWAGADCATDEEITGPFRAFFEVPRGGQPLAEFYRLPFPNDGRVRNGLLDLSGHPSPGALIPQLGDVAGAVMAGLTDDFQGFGNNEAVFFRFSEDPDFGTMVRDLPSDGGTIGLVDVTPGATYGEYIYGSHKASTGRGQYICDRWLAMAPSTSNPLRGGHTFLAYVTTGVRSKDGTAIAADADFTVMMGSAQPSDADLAHVWQAYAPLRAWMTDQGLSASDMAGAAVFTVQDPVEPALALRDAVLASPAPVASDLHLCDGGAGPYADGEDATRGCGALASGFDEVQGLVSVPMFQDGTPPYKDLADGGAIDFSGSGPFVVRTEQVVFSLTVPKGPMPVGGWPIVLYGHGTGGNYQSAVRGGIAAQLAQVDLDDGSSVQFATLTIDAVLHGPRRHAENWDDAWLALDPDAYEPDVLYFNPINPAAARDNPLQAAADHWQLVRLVNGLDWSSSTSPTGAAVRIDPDAIYYMGHSQGSTNGVAFVAYEPGVKAAVFSGAGALLIEALTNKTKPVDIPAAIRVGLADPDIDRYHPLLNIAQAAAERSDGINHARQVIREPVTDNAPKHVFQTFGWGDSYSPNATQEALVKSLRLDQIPGDLAPLSNVSQVTPPVTGNRGSTTAVVALFEPVGANDAHFVLFDREDASRMAMRFLATAALDGTPTVEAP